MDVIIPEIIMLSPFVMLIFFIMSLVFFLVSPKGSQRRRNRKILTIIFGVLLGLAVAAVFALVISIFNAKELYMTGS